MKAASGQGLRPLDLLLEANQTGGVLQHGTHSVKASGQCVTGVHHSAEHSDCTAKGCEFLQQLLLLQVGLMCTPNTPTEDNQEPVNPPQISQLRHNRSHRGGVREPGRGADMTNWSTPVQTPAQVKQAARPLWPGKYDASKPHIM